MRAKHTLLRIGELGNYGHRHLPCLLTPGGEINRSRRSRPGAVLGLPARSPDPESLILFSGHLHPASTGHPGRKAWTRWMLYPSGGNLLAGNGALKDASVVSWGNCARGLCNVTFYKVFRCKFSFCISWEKLMFLLWAISADCRNFLTAPGSFGFFK